VSSVFAFRSKADHAAPAISRNLIRAILAALTGVCALFLLWRFAGLPLLTIRHVLVESDVPLSEGEVLSLAGLRGTEHWHTLSPSEMERRLERSSLISSASVRKVFPDTVRMTLRRRQPAALVLAEAGGRSIPVLVDGEGLVFKVGTTANEVDLPVVSGISMGETGLGARLPRAYATLFADLSALRAKSPSLYRLLSEVRIVPPVASSATGFDILLYLTSSSVPVRARGTVDESLVKYALMVLDLLSNQGILKDIQELDFRSGEVVYRLKGG
jgi:cell division protein FtsQ